MNNNCNHIGESKYGNFQNELLAKIVFSLMHSKESIVFSSFLAFFLAAFNL